VESDGGLLDTLERSPRPGGSRERSSMNELSSLFTTVLVLVMLAAGCATAPDPSPTSSGTGGATLGVPAMGPIVGTPLATFDGSDLDRFSLNTFAEATNLANAVSPATMTWEPNDGSPDLGCVKITAPYSGPDQWVDLEAPPFAAPLPDWNGRTLHVRVKLDPSSSFTGNPRLYVKTGTAYVFYTTAFKPYPQGSGWLELTMPLVSPAPVPPANPGADATQIITYGLDPITAGAPAMTPTAVTFYVDSFSIE
jgi:hypothetical protein